MAFDEATIQAVWEKGTIVSGYNSLLYRKDECGAWMVRKAYGHRDSEYGWEIDHISPQANGGSDVLSNLRPLQWQNNAHKSNGRLSTYVTAAGDNNIVVGKR